MTFLKCCRGQRESSRDLELVGLQFDAPYIEVSLVVVAANCPQVGGQRQRWLKTAKRPLLKINTLHLSVRIAIQSSARFPEAGSTLQ